MKVTKIKNKSFSENQPSSSIQSYFKAAPKESVQRTVTDIKSVYVDALKDKLKSFDDESYKLTNEIDPRQENYAEDVAATAVQATERVDENKTNECNGGRCEWRIKYEELKKSYIKLSLRHTDMLMKHDELLQTSTTTVRLNSEKVSDGVSATAADDVFTENEMKCLQSLPLDKKKDSTFILNCIQYAYKSNAASLCNKTLKGTLERVEIEDGVVVTVKPAKESLTPEKVQRIEQLFIDRVSKSKCLAAEFGERVKQTNINRLIASGIKNVSNKAKIDDKMSNQNSDLVL